MSRRSKDWNEGLSADLRDPDFAKEFILSAMEENIGVQEVLGKVIRAFGVKEFSEKTGIPSPGILRTINLKHNPTQQSLNKLLEPFGLKLSVSPIAKVA